MMDGVTWPACGRYHGLQGGLTPFYMLPGILGQFHVALGRHLLQPGRDSVLIITGEHDTLQSRESMPLPVCRFCALP
jgi:hypothetical protein